MNDTRAVEDQLIHHTGQCARFGCDMLIVDGGSHDGTGEIAKRYGKVMAAPGSVNAGAAVSGMTLISWTKHENHFMSISKRVAMLIG